MRTAVLGILLFYASGALASTELDMAIANVRNNCGGIASELNHMKTMAGINTAVTGVGTATGVGATAVGIVKATKDRELEQLEATIDTLKAEGFIPIENEDDFAEFFGGFLIETGDPEYAEIGRVIQEENRLKKQSKQLGNWRTGLLATNTATNMAGTIIAANNTVKDSLQSQIDDCIASVNNLSNVRMQAYIGGEINQDEMEYTERIITTCGAWQTVNINSINNKSKSAAISSGVGTGIGLVGTITSAIANTDATRNDNTESGKQKEKNLNTTSNIMAGGATVASGVATVFNATQISAIKKAAEVADNCEEVLK